MAYVSQNSFSASVGTESPGCFMSEHCTVLGSGVNPDTYGSVNHV